MTAYLGFSCSQHDPSIAVIHDEGGVVFAEANERGLKNKRGWHAPPDALGLIEPILDRYVGGAPIDANLTWSRAALAAAPERTFALMAPRYQQCRRVARSTR